jgi:phosphoglucosamine mutase
VPDNSVRVMDGELTRFRLFGTDGVRGVANQELTAELALELAVAAAHVLGEAGAFEGHRPLAVVGRDPRASGEFLEAAVVAGLASAGVDVLRLGMLPTPAVAYLTAELKADLGVMLSASTIRCPTTGSSSLRAAATSSPTNSRTRSRRGCSRSGSGRSAPESAECATIPKRPIATSTTSSPRCRTGSTASRWWSTVRTGRPRSQLPRHCVARVPTVIAIGCEPDGLNINEGCGSTDLDLLTAAVVANSADLGIAHDGDADRCLAVAADGSVIDGDQILAILSIAMNESGRLAQGTVVATVMSNLGFRLGMEAAGIKVVETAVGDRYVLEAMRADGYTVGGEQSGHVILLDYATTGDGILTALQLLARITQTKQSLTELAAVMHRLPQVLINVTDVDRTRAETDAALLAAVERASSDLGASGRILLRPSGTEPVVRVMVEAATRDKADAVAGELARVVRERLG